MASSNYSPFGKYILVDKQPVLEEDLLAWAVWYETANRCVAREELSDGTIVSTVFISIDHSFGYYPKPHLFETAIIRGEYFELKERYATWDGALGGHNRIVKKLQLEHSGKTL